MPVQHRRKQRVPLDLEPELMRKVEETVTSLSIPRGRLLRILIKYGITHLQDALRQGDSLRWQNKQTQELVEDTNATTTRSDSTDG